MILNTGDVPNLYAADEKAEILEKMQAAARELVIAISKIYEYMFYKGFNLLYLNLKNLF